MSALKLLGDTQATTMPGPIASGFYSIWESWLSRYSIIVNKFLLEKKIIHGRYYFDNVMQCLILITLFSFPVVSNIKRLKKASRNFRESVVVLVPCFYNSSVIFQ